MILDKLEVSFVGKSFDSVCRIVSWLLQCFKDTNVACMWFVFTLFGVFFYDLLNRGLTRTLSNIPGRVSCESNSQLKVFNNFYKKASS